MVIQLPAWFVISFVIFIAVALIFIAVKIKKHNEKEKARKKLYKDIKKIGE